uniref:Transposase n=1 Tax=Curvibacter symbiont subsp. Hydra magnipapillata TaxID=667019 RepID=C9Y924_CURXX|nr:hypothetical protein Csp_A06250 [Curvibacter putative symbiont of Hydra magnipapillata]
MPQTLNELVKKSASDSGAREGDTSDERERIKALKREVKELRRANYGCRLNNGSMGERH